MRKKILFFITKESDLHLGLISPNFFRQAKRSQPTAVVSRSISPTIETLSYELNFVHHLPNPFAIHQICLPKKLLFLCLYESRLQMVDEIDPLSYIFYVLAIILFTNFYLFSAAKRRIEIMKTGFSTVPRLHTVSRVISLSSHMSTEELKVLICCC